MVRGKKLYGCLGLLLLIFLLAGCAQPTEEACQAELDQANETFGTNLVLADIPPLEEPYTLRDYRQWVRHVAQCQQIIDETNAKYGTALTRKDAIPNLEWDLEDYRSWVESLGADYARDARACLEFGMSPEQVKEWYGFLPEDYALPED